MSDKKINVRKALNAVYGAIAKSSKYELFNVNCDEVDEDDLGPHPYRHSNNELVADIYIKPAKPLKYVRLNFISTPSGVSFEEVAGTAQDDLDRYNG